MTAKKGKVRRPKRKVETGPYRIVHTWPSSPLVGVTRRFHSAASFALGYGGGMFHRVYIMQACALVGQGLRVGLAPQLLYAVLEFERSGHSLTGKTDVLQRSVREGFSPLNVDFEPGVYPVLLQNGERMECPLHVCTARLHELELSR